MAEDHLSAKLSQLRISENGEIMSGQSSILGSSVTGWYSGVKEAEHQDLTSTENKITLPIGDIPPDDSLSFKIELDSGVPGETEKKLELLLQEKKSLEEWSLHIQNISTAYRNNLKKVSPSKNNTTVKKLGVKKQPFKHKSLLAKPKLICLQGKSKPKSQTWLRNILQMKVENSNLLQKSKLNYRPVKSKVNSSEWIKSIPDNQEENANWARNTDISLAFEQLSDPRNAPTNECKLMEIDKEISKHPPNPYDFQGLIKECNKLKEDIYEPHESRSDSGDVTPNELAGYIDTIMHIPKEMSAMAESMYM